MPMKHGSAYRERFLGRLVLCALIWIGLHAVTMVRNFVTLFDCAFSGFAPLSIVLGMAYVLSLLAVDVLVCAAESRSAAGVFMKFWAVCGVLTALSFWEIQGPLADLLATSILLLTPSLPLSWLREWVNVNVFTGIVLLLFLIQFIYMAGIFCRAGKKEVSMHGPVGPGAGTVE